jgi:hypothetical protein
MRWTRAAFRRTAQARTAKACGPGTPGLVLRSRVPSPRTTVTKRSWTPGRARHKRSNHRAGNVDVSASPVVTTLVCFLHFAHKAAGAAKHPAFPAPSFSKGACRHKTRARGRGGIVDVCLRAVIASEAKQSRAPNAILDCFVASLLAMTTGSHRNCLRNQFCNLTPSVTTVAL